MNKQKTKPKKSLKKTSDDIYVILDLHSEAIEDGNILFADIIKRLEFLESGK
jgi:hypothetical protein